MDTQVREVGQRMRDYLADLSNFVEGNPPPGENAGNGYVREMVISLRAYDRMPDGSDLRGTNHKGAHLFFAYNYLHWAIRQSFENNNNYCSDWRNIKVVIQNATIVADVTKIISDILGIIGGDQNAETSLVQDIQKLVNDVKSNGDVTDGCHLNGWVSHHINRNSKSVISETDKYINHIGGIQDKDTKNLIEIIKEICRKFQTLPTEHPVWLTAEWQIKFLAAVKAARFSTENYLKAS